MSDFSGFHNINKNFLIRNNQNFYGFPTNTTNQSWGSINPVSLWGSYIAAWYSMDNGNGLSYHINSGTSIDNWYDISGNNNHLTQITLANMPTLTSNVLNGFDGITFVWTNPGQTFSFTSPITATINDTYIAIYKKTTSNKYCCFMTSTGGSYFGTLFVSYSNSTIQYCPYTSTSYYAYSTSAISDYTNFVCVTLVGNGVAIGNNTLMYNNTASLAYSIGTGTGTLQTVTTMGRYSDMTMVEFIVLQGHQATPQELSQYWQYYIRAKYPQLGT